MVLIYYGFAEHRKGIVDVMSSFGVKEPLRKEIIQSDFWYLSSLNRASSNMKYFHISQETLKQKRNVGEINTLRLRVLKTKNDFLFPNGAVQIKEICSGQNCIVGNFINCSKEKGTLYHGGHDLSIVSFRVPHPQKNEVAPPPPPPRNCNYAQPPSEKLNLQNFT